MPSRSDNFTAGGDVDQVRVSLRVVGDSLDPDEISHLLGAIPTIALRKGELRGTEPRQFVQPTGVWSLHFNGIPQEWTLGDSIVELLRLVTRDVQVWQHLATRFRLDIFCGLNMEARNRGFEIGPDVLQQLSERRLSLGVDIYYVGEASH